MFKWKYECYHEVNLPVCMVWEIHSKLSNWVEWNEHVESVHDVGEIKTGSTIKLKIKNNNSYFPVFFTEINPFSECKFVIKAPLVTQNSSYSFKEISPRRTGIDIKISLSSFLTPFMKSLFLRATEKSLSISFQALDDASLLTQPIDSTNKLNTESELC